MRKSVAIIGSGPTGVFTLKGLVASKQALSITVFEIEAEPGKGTPYHPHVNDRSMLANIASYELPPVCETLVAWLYRQTDDQLSTFNLSREQIDERNFYPRIVLGAYFHAQFQMLIEQGLATGHSLAIKPLHRVVDIVLRRDDIQLSARSPNSEVKEYAYDHVVMATGHNWPDVTETKPGYFVSPWPASALKTIEAGAVGILGTSLSAIDAVMTVATAHGAFMLDSAGVLQYNIAQGRDALHVTMMSRKGLLPEADFYFDYPHPPPQFCTAEAIDALTARGSIDLLDDVFELFRQELVACDESYSAKIGLAFLDVETFAQAYFAERAAADPFVWAASNLAEAEQNEAKRYTVRWRDAILRMHEVIARVVPHLDETDLKRFHKKFKSVFVDNYATVPHESIHRILALRRAGVLSIVALGNDYTISTEEVAKGAIVHHHGTSQAFDAFVDATGQPAMSVDDLPFPSLVEQRVLKAAATPADSDLIGADEVGVITRTGGIDLDTSFRPNMTKNLSRNLYCAAIAFLLHKLPFVQGITSAHEIGGIVSTAIRQEVEDSSPSLVPASERAEVLILP